MGSGIPDLLRNFVETGRTELTRASDASREVMR
jgi:hypothetical protein